MNARALITPLIFATFVIVAACANPFAPRLDENAASDNVLGDQRTLEGVFQNFRLSYLFKDTLIYGKLLAPNFRFEYRNFDQVVETRDWGRDEDLVATTGLFQSAEALDLVWNGIIIDIGDSLRKDVSRGFNLTVTFSPTDVLRVDGKVNLRVARSAPEQPWLIERWIDESNF